MHPAMNKIGRLGVIGDVHAEDVRLEMSLAHLEQEGVDAIICTGDIVDGAGCPDQVAGLLQDYDVATVRGNHDRWLIENRARHVPDAHQQADLSDESMSYLASLPTQIEIETTLGKLLLCHGIGDNDLQKIWPGTPRLPMEKSEQLDEIISEGNYRFLINGHMHYRSLIHFETLTLLNAGTLKGLHRPGFSLIDFEQRDITAFECDAKTVTFAKHLPLDPPQGSNPWSNTQAFTGGWQPLVLYPD